MKTYIKFILIFLFFSLSFQLFAETNTTPKPYETEEFPQEMQDLRRFEIISLGSMPFITLDAAIVYNGYKYAVHKTDKFNPLATANYDQKEMTSIIITSLCISTGIGITDYVIRLIKRNKAEKISSKKNENITISQIESDPDAIKLPLPDSNKIDNSGSKK